MTALLIAFIIISFTLYSLGEMLIYIYRAICKCNENYNPFDKIILGLCFITIPLSIYSFWLPTNHILLLILIICSLGYWTISKRLRRQTISNIKQYVSQLPKTAWLSIILIILVVMCGSLWSELGIDSMVYHVPQITWNESYPVIPGLANIEDRMGFNSNYLLTSSIYTFRFLWNTPVYFINGTLLIWLTIWVLYRLFVSKAQIIAIFIFFAYALLFLLNIKLACDTSTDLAANYIIFYLLCKIVLNPTALKKELLLFYMLPIFLLTYKLSIAPIALFSLLILIQLIKNRQYKIIIFLNTTALLILIFWLTRNVIISGYLIFPLHNIDIFTFDWKVPKDVAILESIQIKRVGNLYFKIIQHPHVSFREPYWQNILIIIVYILNIISLTITSIKIVISLVKKRKQIRYLLILFVITSTNIIIWFVSAPDFRFICGILCFSLVLIALNFEGNKIYKLRSKPMAYIAITCFLILIYGWTSQRVIDKHTIITSRIANKDQVSSFTSVLLKPYDYKSCLVLKNIDLKFTPYTINNNITILLSNTGFTIDYIPAMSTYQDFIFSSYECVEARGNSIKDGFRPKKECLEDYSPYFPFNIHKPIYIEEQFK